tara:strand:+ start:278 stop:1630 length:1353 start_codon:yes stop_codon:yes gene_type:complete
MGRKIAVVGASPAGFIQLASLVKHKLRYNKFSEDEFVLIHDPDKVWDDMVSGTTPSFFDELSEVTTISRRWLKKYADATDCHGYKYVGWGKRRDKNTNLAFRFQTAAHFDIAKFRQELIKDGGKVFGPDVSIIEEKIDSFELVGSTHCTINGVAYDYVIDCTDKQPLYAPLDYSGPTQEFVDTAVVLEKPIAGDWDFTIEYAGKHGHITGVPLQSKQLWTYFYHQSADFNDVMKDFAEAFPDEDISGYKRTVIDWDPRLSNYLAHPDNNRYLRNGLALINIEPLTGCHHECSRVMANVICQWMWGEFEDDDLMGMYTELIRNDYQPHLCFMYHFGSRHDTPFWQNAVEKSCEYLRGAYFLHPAYFPGKDWLNEILSDDWGSYDYRRLISNEEGDDDLEGRNRVVPYVIMSDYTLFAEICIGFGAPYADKFVTLDMVDPPEEYGTIGYEYY